MKITFHQNMSNDLAVRLEGASIDGRTYRYTAYDGQIWEIGDSAMGPGWTDVMPSDDDMVRLVVSAYLAGHRRAIIWTHEFTADMVIVMLGNLLPLLNRLRG